MIYRLNKVISLKKSFKYEWNEKYQRSLHRLMTIIFDPSLKKYINFNISFSSFWYAKLKKIIFHTSFEIVFSKIRVNTGYDPLERPPHGGYSTYRPRSLVRQSALTPTTNQSFEIDEDENCSRIELLMLLKWK